MKIKDLPEFRNKKDLLSRPEDTPLPEAVKAMVDRQYGSVVVTDAKGKLTGIVTERDLMTRVIYPDRNPHTLKLKDIMTENVKTALLDDEVLVCLRQMSNNRFRHLPVVDDGGNVVGMMSQGDFVAYTWPELMTRVKENAVATVTSNYQIFLIIGGILVYTLAMVALLRM